MRKSFLLILVCCLFSNLMHAQFEVQSTGYSISNNITMDGVMGGAMWLNGVLTVKSNKIDPKYNSFLGFGLGLIRTDCGGFKNVYPYSNISSNRVNFYVRETGPDGSKGILYSDLVPVLIESIKELQVQVDEQKAQLSVSQPKNAPQQASQSGKSTLVQQAELFQNNPNPFNQETEIGYRLSGDAVTASICIYNLNG